MQAIENVVTTKCYQISHQGGTLSFKGKYNFDDFNEAIIALNDFISNPKKDNPTMTDDNVEYWKKRKYIIEYRINTVIEIAVIN